MEEKNTIIFLCDPTGIGKSTISNKLKKKGFFRIDVDTIIKSALARFDDELLMMIYNVLMEKKLAPEYKNYDFFKLSFENAFQDNEKEPAAALYSMIHPDTELHVDILEGKLEELYKAALSPAYSRYLIEHRIEYCAEHKNIVMDFGSRKGTVVTPEFSKYFGAGFKNRKILCMLPSDGTPKKIIQNILDNPEKKDTEETNVHTLVKRASLIKYLENKVKEIDNDTSKLSITPKEFNRIKRFLSAGNRKEKTEFIESEPKMLEAVSTMIKPSIQCRINTLATHFEEIHDAQILLVDINDTSETIIRKLEAILETTPQLSPVPSLKPIKEHSEESFAVPPSTVPSRIKRDIFETETDTSVTALRQTKRTIVKQSTESRGISISSRI